MFNRVDVTINSVELEYITKGNLESISLAIPDGVSYSQWSGAWEAFKEFLESRQPTLDDYVERQVDVTEVAELEAEVELLQDQVNSLERENSSLENECGSLEDRISDLVIEVDDLNSQVSELEAEISRLLGEE